jgi:hypothetical protein
MPIARANLKDGTTLDYYVPEGTTAEERLSIYAPAALEKVAMGIDPLEPPETTLGGYVGEIGRGLASGAAGLVESAATGAAFLLPEEAEQAARQAIAEKGAEVQRGLLPAAGYEDTVVRKLAEATGSTIPFLATGLLGTPGLAAGIATGAAAGAGEAAKRAEAAGATEEEISKAAGLGLIPGLGETLVPFAIGKSIRAGVAARGLGKSLGEAPAGDALSRLRRVASAAGGEGLQEASAEVAQNLISQGVYDPETGTFAGTGESLGYGAGVGGLLAALAELAIPGRPRARGEAPTDLTEGELAAIGQREETAALPPPEAPLEGEIVEPEGPLALPQGTYQLPPPPTGDGSAILVRPDGKAYPAKYAAAFEEAIAEEERLRTDAPQRELFTELLSGEKNAITKEDLARLGITSKKLKDELPALNLADPKDAQKAIDTIVKYANNPLVKSKYASSRTKVLGLLNMPVLTRAEKEYATQAVEEGVAPQQMTLEEGAKRQEEDIAYAGREAQLAEQQKQADLKATLQAKQTATQQEAVERAAQLPEGTPTAMGAALQAAAAQANVQPSEITAEPVEEVDMGVEAPLSGREKARVAEAAARTKAKREAEKAAKDAAIAAEASTRRKPTPVVSVAEQEAAPVVEVEEEVTTPEVEAAAVAAEEGDIDADVTRAEAEAISQPTPEAQATRSTSREEDKVLIFDEVLSNPQGPVSKYFRGKKTLEEGIDALAADMSTGLTKENVAAQEWVKANLSVTSRKDLSDTVRVMRESMGLPLPAAAIAVSSQPLSQQIRDKLNAGDLRGAINDLTQSTDVTVSRVATAIEKGLGNTKVVMASDLVNAEGKTVAGLYDPKTDTITLNQDADLRNHVLLHEAMHAVTSHEIAKNTPAAQQMRNLFESVKDRLDTAYGATNIDEFVAEAFSNPEFQAKLGRITPKGEKISLWSRFKNIIENIIRRFRGQPSKKIESAMDKADSLVAELISPAPESRDAAKMYSATVEGEEKATLDASGRFAKGKISAEDIAVASTAFGTLGRQAQNALMQFLPLNAVYKIAKEKYPRMAEKAEELFKLLQTKNGDRQKYLNMTKDTADAVERIIGKDKKVKEVLNNWTAESTLARVDPTKPESKYKGDEAALDAWNMMNDMLKGMTPAQQQAVKDSYVMLRDSYSKIYEMLVQTMNTRLDQIEDSEIRKTLKDKLLTQLLQKEAIEPYFPLYRKGSHWVFYSARDPRTGQVEVYKEAFQSEYAQQEAARQLRNTEGVDNIETYKRDPKNSNFGQVDAQFAFNLLADVRAKGADQKIQDVILDSLFDIMPERSLVRAFKPRQGIRGFETDAVKVFRERMPNFTNQIVNLKHDLALSKISNELADRKNEYKATPELFSGAEALNEQLQGYVNFARNPKIATWSKALKTAGFGMTLGFNVSSVIVNATNLPIVVLPYLGGRYGFTDTMKAMNDARKLFMSTGMKRRTETFTGEGTREVFEGPSLSNIDFSDTNLTPEQRELEELYLLMEARGQANISTTSENLDMENPANTAWTATNAYMGWMFHQGERFNRQVTAITSYKLELANRAKKGEITEQDRKEAAEIALEDTELTNSGAMAETAPRVAQNNMGNWMLMYKRFGISMYYLQFQMAKQALSRAKTSEERAEAKRQIVGLFASSAIFAGVQGLPLYGIVSMIGNAVFLDDEDEDFDSIAASYFGEGLYSGAINAIFNVDVAPRIGMTNLVYRSLPNREQESLILQAMEIIGGPIFGIASRMEDGFGLISEGEVSRGMERLLPSALSNGMKALRYGTEGATTMRGDPILEDINAWNVFAQSLGLAPAGYTKQLEVNARDKGLERRLNTKRTDMMRDYYMALKEGDIDSAMELVEEMVSFSQRNPTAAISGDTLQRSMRQHRVSDEIARQLGGITTSQRSMQRIIQRRMEDMGEE